MTLFLCTLAAFVAGYFTALAVVSFSTRRTMRRLGREIAERQAECNDVRPVRLGELPIWPYYPQADHHPEHDPGLRK